MAKLPKLAAALTTQDTRLSDVLRLSLIEGLSIRAIAQRLHLSRKTVRKLLGRASERKPPSSEPRTSLLEPYDAEIRRLLAETPEFKTPAILERLRPLGYTGGRLLHVGRNTVYGMVARNAIPHRRLGKQIRFNQVAIMRWLDSWSSQDAKEGQ